ncbi:MAG: lytic transglycosylase domain-containing protein [Paracoccaceae bacterium]|nr:lytic transglycosylase domain-containing protein [Paracoccaceae bacterium]MDG2260068.1 lytic transglycosylase domain-containing protein [Paracoccaceae bacterium]
MQVVLRAIILVCCVLSVVLPATGAQSANSLELALKEMRVYRWDSAKDLAAQDGPLAADIIEWHWLRAGHGNYQDVSDFLERNADWPGLALLRKNSEKSLIGQSARDVLDFFKDQDPVTATGAILYAQALKRTGEMGASKKVVTRAWLENTMSDAEFEAFSKQFSDSVADIYIDRLDAMLWRDAGVEVVRLQAGASADWKKLSAARSALRNDKDGVDKLIAQVPASLKADAGLAYERFAWRVRKGRDEDALKIILERSTSEQSLGRPEYWATQRRNLARQKFSDGDIDTAYQLASQHFLPPNDARYADLEWMAGYIALRFKQQPDVAIAHFQGLLEAVDSPISLSRAGYWLGRAFEAKGEERAAQISWEEAAKHSTAYYGLLAAEKLGQAPRFQIYDIPQDAWKTASFTHNDVFHAGLLSLSLNENYLAERFFVQLSESLMREELILLGSMLEQLNQPHLVLRVAKHGLRMGDLAFSAYFPLHPMSTYELPINPELVLAIARRESEFDPTAVSRAGAAGLLQLMPATANEMAGKLDLPSDQQRLVTDWRFNAALGSAYLAELSSRFDGNIALVAAAYNAGPTRVDQWLQTLGDPRKPSVDVVDWIESIPYRETRNYVMRVSESMPAYRARMGLPRGVPFSQELSGSTLDALTP